MQQYEKLFSEGQIGTVQLKNRVVMSPMVLGTGGLDGTPGEQMMQYYEERAKGGVGLIITEATRVDEKHGPLAPRQLAMSKDRHIEPFAKMVKRIHRHGAKVFCQLHHPGRQNLSLLVGTWRLSEAIGRHWHGYWDIFFKVAQHADMVEKTGLLPPVVAPSPVPCRLQKQKTRALKTAEIKELVREFGAAAKRVQLAGADGVELHGAHGYLIQEFLSPYTNRRTDEYGGSFDNRMRFITEIIAEIRRQCGADFPIIARISVDEFYREIGDPADEGITLDEGIRIAKRLEECGIDAIDVSSATYETMNYWLEPTSFQTGWRSYLAKTVKQNVSIPVLAANLIRSPEQAEQQLKEGIQDFISLGRPLLADPDWANKAKAGRPEEIRRCICCLWCFESMLDGAVRNRPGQCAVNPRTCREVGIPKEPKKDGDGRIVAIVGAGVSGVKGVVERRENAMKEEYQKFIAPVIMNDPSPFDDLSQADIGQLMEAAVWSLLRSDPDPDRYPYEEGGYMVIPQADVEKQFEYLFGTEVKPQHATITGYGYEFPYDAATKTYHIPVAGVDQLYTAQIYEIEKKGATTYLTVGYIAGGQWVQDANGDIVAPEPDKYMKITLREKGESYYISAIQATDPPETAATKAQPSETEGETVSEAPASSEGASSTAAATIAAAQSTAG